jgi:DnaK suppressor protein
MKEALLRLRDDLLGLAGESAEHAAVVELDQGKVGRLSRMDAMQAQAMAQETLKRREAKLRDIDAALQRIEEDEYGLCANCDEPINPKRLAVDPTASFCIDCAHKDEQPG